MPSRTVSYSIHTGIPTRTSSYNWSADVIAMVRVLMPGLTRPLAAETEKYWKPLP